MAQLAGHPGDAPVGEPGGDSILLTTSCTTGWADWVHGELWLCRDGLLRLSLGLPATIAKSFGQGQAAAAPLSSPRHFDQAEISELLSRKRTNVWVPWIQIREASLRRGLITSRLRLALMDGRAVKFLWLPAPRAFDLLRDRLAERLGPGLRIGG